MTLAQPRPFTSEQAERALAAFRISCPRLLQRQDASGLTSSVNWQPLCTEAVAVPAGGATAFFQSRFEWVKVGTDPAFATGYYEPEILGSRTPQPGYAVPIYRTPSDLIRCTRADGQTGRGRYDATGQCVLYFTRPEIEDGVLAGKGLEFAFAADPVELFFLEIQGSGRLKLLDGTVLRLGYDNQNGREYVAIGRLLRERGILPPGGANMAAIKAWMKSQPDGGRSLMRENPSFIFFRELTGPGPLGALNVPVTPRSTVAADPLFVPLGAPVWLDVDRPEADGLWVAQDTGGAIKGANRFDTFWGAGDYATQVAGGMAAKGEALLLLPRGTVAQAQARGQGARAVVIN
ncbi:MAG: GH102 [uncultured Sphingomonas sp.]|uniref:peptidoglycan lytic exotransglycosylase n=1 Tax=uncultured Sphingomonas sp. TaxID=158754 RepID=A0A6J4T552_9SPHN|nr:MAG: GH102 [uncultured Sphingomonas sp.]